MHTRRIVGIQIMLFPPYCQETRSRRVQAGP